MKWTGSNYSLLPENPNKFNELKLLLRKFLLVRLYACISIGVLANNTQDDQSWYLRYKNTKLEINENRLLEMNVVGYKEVTARKRSESKSRYASKNGQETKPFFCEVPGHSGLHEAATFQLDSRVREDMCADSERRVHCTSWPYSVQDTVPQETKYRTNYLLSLNSPA